MKDEYHPLTDCNKIEALCQCPELNPASPRKLSNRAQTITFTPIKIEMDPAYQVTNRFKILFILGYFHPPHTYSFGVEAMQISMLTLDILFLVSINRSLSLQVKISRKKTPNLIGQNVRNNTSARHCINAFPSPSQIHRWSPRSILRSQWWPRSLSVSYLLPPQLAYNVII